MSSHLPPSSKQHQGKRLERPDVGRESGGGKIHLYTVTDTDAALLGATGNSQPLKEIEKTTGADVQFDPKPAPIPGSRVIIVRGLQSQINEAVRLMSDKTCAKVTNLKEAETFWLQWVEDAFPSLDYRAYFLPPVHLNCVPRTRQLFAGQDVLVLQSASGQACQSASQQGGQSKKTAMVVLAVTQSSILQPPTVQDSDIRNDAAMQRVFLSLQKMSEKNKEVLVGMSQLQFGQYLGEPCYAAAAAQLPLPASLPPALPRNWKHGDFDVLLIHRHYGMVVCEVKSFGQNVTELNMSQQDIDKNIRKKLKEAVSQLDKAEAMLSHLVSDIAPGLRITKTIAVPNLTSHQVQQAISGDLQLIRVMLLHLITDISSGMRISKSIAVPKLTARQVQKATFLTQFIKELCQSLGTTDPANITGLCLYSDQLSDPRTPWNVSSNVLRKLGNWWQRRVAGAGADSHVTCDVYKRLVARFCGPATTVTVPCTSPPRLCIKTLGQAVSHTGECYTAEITLFPEQVHLLNMAPPRLFVFGPPGTGKSVVLLLMGIEWLRCGDDVYVVSTWSGSRAACSMLYHLLLQAVKVIQTAGIPLGRPRLLQYDFDVDHVETVVKDVSQKTRGGSLHVIAEEAISGSRFTIFCDKLMKQVPRLRLWAASCFEIDSPDDWQVKFLTRSLRFPPVVVREVEQDWCITEGGVRPYSERDFPDYTDGPPIKLMYHQGQDHPADLPADCVTCGREVATFLHSLHVGVPVNATPSSTTATSISGGTSPPGLQWRDVLVLSLSDLSDTLDMVTALEEAGVKVRVMTDDDIEDVATARSDVVWMANGALVRGLERKVVVCLQSGFGLSDRLYLMSRCTSQLVIVSLGHKNTT